MSGDESFERVEERERREKGLTTVGKSLSDCVDPGVTAHLDVPTDPVDLDSGLLTYKTVELTGIYGEFMVGFRRFSRGDVLDSESAVAENQRSSQGKVRETTEEDPKANV